MRETRKLPVDLHVFSTLRCTQTIIKATSPANPIHIQCTQRTDPAISQCKAKNLLASKLLGIVKPIGLHFKPKPSLSSTAPQSLASSTAGVG